MPAGGAATIGTGRVGQEALDLSVCLAILKKAIVLIPVLIMVILYLIRTQMSTEPNAQDDLILANLTILEDSFFNQTHPAREKSDHVPFKTAKFRSKIWQSMNSRRKRRSIWTLLRHQSSEKSQNQIDRISQLFR